jgi:multiple sugar transport system permease protein
MLVPLLIGLSYAFRDITLLDPTSGGFVGLDHFRELYADPSFWNALRNTVTWTAPRWLQFGLGLMLALLLNRAFSRARAGAVAGLSSLGRPEFLVGTELGVAVQPGGRAAAPLVRKHRVDERTGQSAV